MNQVVKSVRHIHIKQVSKFPVLYQAIITYEPFPISDNNAQHNQQKHIVNKLIKDEWFAKIKEYTFKDYY